MTYKELLKLGETLLIDADFEQNIAKNDARDILLYCSHVNYSKFIIKQNEEIPLTLKDVYLKNISMRANKKPLSYITNHSCFFGYDFFINENCLIPRIDSEILIEQAIEKSKNKNFQQQITANNNTINVLDLCCGSGCLGLSYAKAINKLCPQVKISLTLIDKSSPAIQVAKINANKLNIKTKFIIADMSYGIGNDKYDIIICNPPYIETKTIDTLDKEVKNFEPTIALDGGEDGLKFYRIIADKIVKNISTKGIMILEIGYNQKINVEKIFNDINIKTEIVKDYGNKDRCIIIDMNKNNIKL